MHSALEFDLGESTEGTPPPAIDPASYESLEPPTSLQAEGQTRIAAEPDGEPAMREVSEAIRSSPPMGGVRIPFGGWLVIVVTVVLTAGIELGTHGASSKNGSPTNSQPSPGTSKPATDASATDDSTETQLNRVTYFLAAGKPWEAYALAHQLEQRDLSTAERQAVTSMKQQAWEWTRR